VKYYVNLNVGGGRTRIVGATRARTATRVLVRKYFLLLMVASERIEEDSERRQQKSA
jgi:hypothetical protein